MLRGGAARARRVPADARGRAPAAAGGRRDIDGMPAQHGRRIGRVELPRLLPRAVYLWRVRVPRSRPRRARGALSVFRGPPGRAEREPAPELHFCGHCDRDAACVLVLCMNRLNSRRHARHGNERAEDVQTCDRGPAGSMCFDFFHGFCFELCGHVDEPI